MAQSSNYWTPPLYYMLSYGVDSQHLHETLWTKRVNQTSLWCGRCCQQGSFRNVGTRGCPSQVDPFCLGAASPPEATLHRSPLPTASTSCAGFALCHTDATLSQGNLPTSLPKHESIKNNKRHTKAGREKPMRPQPYTKSYTLWGQEK